MIISLLDCLRLLMTIDQRKKDIVDYYLQDPSTQSQQQ